MRQLSIFSIVSYYLLPGYTMARAEISSLETVSTDKDFEGRNIEG